MPASKSRAKRRTGNALAPSDLMAIPTGGEIYDMIMGAIEPELLQSNIDHLDEPYAGETEEQRTSRYERYSKAFARYRIAFQEWAGNVMQAVREYQRSLFKTAEQKSRQLEEQSMVSLEQAMAI